MFGKTLFLLLKNFCSCWMCYDMFVILALIILRQEDCHSSDNILDNLKTNRTAMYRARTCLKIITSDNTKINWLKTSWRLDNHFKMYLEACQGGLEGKSAYHWQSWPPKTVTRLHWHISCNDHHMQDIVWPCISFPIYSKQAAKASGKKMGKYKILYTANRYKLT